MLAGPGGWHEAQVAPADPARVTLVSARDLAGGQPVSEGRRKLCHGGFVDGAGDGIVYEVTWRHLVAEALVCLPARCWPTAHAGAAPTTEGWRNTSHAMPLLPLLQMIDEDGLSKNRLGLIEMFKHDILVFKKSLQIVARSRNIT